MASLKDQIAADKLKVAKAKIMLAQAGESTKQFRRKIAQNQAGLSRLERVIKKSTSGSITGREPKFARLSKTLDKVVILAVIGLVGSVAALHMFKKFRER